ncbi:unnamed protein product [Phytophthora fragariaefolia]|uniref:Unnamed protein product n=1 Tax=Phytophthora fragariaefolia TaxID=1490495 RepID=A0A9W6X198_9STRA|nr:unnamed protein product [Phytophthora fragariaefolia]
MVIHFICVENVLLWSQVSVKPTTTPYPVMVMDLDPECQRGYWKQRDPDLWFEPAVGEVVTKIPGSSRVEAYHSVDTMDLLPGESRGYWKQHSSGKRSRQANIHGKINNEKAILFLDTGAEVSIVDTAFARKVGCYIDRSQSQQCVGIGENVYTTEGRTRIKITLARSLVYIFDIWVGDLPGQEAILGMDFMVPAWIRLDLADGFLCLPDEIRIQLRHDKLWVTRGDRWVPTVVSGPGKTTYLQITNVGEKKLVLCRDERIGMWLVGDRIPRLQGFVSVGSRRCMEWQNLTLQATTDAGSAMAEPIGTMPESMVERPKYQTPGAILRRLDPACIPPTEVGPSGSGDRRDKSSLDPTRQPNTRGTDGLAGVMQLQVTTAQGSEARRQLPVPSSGPDPDNKVTAGRPLDPDPVDEDSPASLDLTVVLGMPSETQDPETARSPAGEETIPAAAASSSNHSETGGGSANPTALGGKQILDPRDRTPDPTDSLDLGPDNLTADEQVCYNESGDLHAEDAAAETAVLSEVTSTTEEVTIEDIQVEDPDLAHPKR